MIIRTKSAYDYCSVDDRCLTHNGVIVDVGCAGWDWCQFFIGKKRVIGIDPFESKIDGVDFFNGILGAANGTTMLFENKDESTIMDETNTCCEGLKTFNSFNFKTFCQKWNIDSISVLKLNIEGAEYPLLHSMDAEDFKMIDQIAVSFHDWINPKWKHLTTSAINLLELNGFTVTKLKSDWGWYLAIKK